INYTTLYHLIFVVKIKIIMKVCITGSGLSSLALANALAKTGISVDIFFLKQKQDKSRTISISKSNVDYFCNHVVDIKKIIWKIKNIKIYSENLDKDSLLNFDNKNEQLFSIVENYKLYEILEKRLNQNKNIKKILKKLDYKLTKKYDLIINTDFSNELTKKFFYKKILKKYDSFAYTSVITHKKISNTIARQIFTKKGPLAFLPISSYRTSIVYSINQKTRINQETLLSSLNRYNNFYQIKRLEKFKSFSLMSVNLRNYYHKNILAFGDLIHRVHPLAGQGFNMTIRDIQELTNIIRSKIELGLTLDASVNSEFEKKTKSRNVIFSNGIDLIHEFFNLDNKINKNVLSKSVKFFGKNSFINKSLIKMADNGNLF
ncbi:MAG: FAD-dependent monooxygenase, partial [Alphaproteobacteria bacterium]